MTTTEVNAVIMLEEPLLHHHGIQEEVSMEKQLQEENKKKSSYDHFRSYLSELMESKNFVIGIYSVLLLFSSVGNSIFNKKMTNAMPNYPYFLSQFTTLVYLPIFGAVVLYEFKFTDYITEEQTKFPKYKFFIMGMLDSIAGIFTLFGGVYTSGNTQGLLFQTVVPITMIMAYFILGTRYRISQVFGALVIMIGVVVVILPKFLYPSTDPTESTTPDKPIFNIIFLLSVLPMAFSTIYKEIAFNDIELDVNYLQYWVAVWQFLFGFLLIPLNTFSFLGPNQMTWSELPYAIWNGMKCLGGYNTIVSHCGPKKLGFDIPCDTCETAYVEVIVYLLFNCLYNVSITLLIKHGSAALLYIIMTLRLPIVNIAFSLKFVENPPEPFDWYYIFIFYTLVYNRYTIGGLISIIFGLSIYRYGSLTSEADKPVEELTSLPIIDSSNYNREENSSLTAAIERGNSSPYSGSLVYNSSSPKSD